MKKSRYDKPWPICNCWMGGGMMPCPCHDPRWCPVHAIQADRLRRCGKLPDPLHQEIGR